MQAYWNEIEVANTENHVAPGFAVRLKFGLSASKQFAEVSTAVDRIAELLSYFAETDKTLNDEIREHLKSLGYDLKNFDRAQHFENSFRNRNWEMHSLAANNALTDLVVALKQTEVRFLEEYANTHPTESDSLASLETAKRELQEMAVSAGYAD